MNTKARIRIYSLEEKGVSFSYSTSDCMIVVGGRYDMKNKQGLLYEMRLMGFQYIDTLVIPNWHNFFCRYKELNNLLNDLQPDKIVYPDKEPQNETDKKEYESLQKYIKGEYSFDAGSNQNNPDFFVKDLNDLFVIFISKGNIKLAFFSHCSNNDHKQFILDSLKEQEIDIIIAGDNCINEGVCKELIEQLPHHTTIGRIDPTRDFNDKNSINVQKEDIFITKVEDEIVRLKLFPDNPILI